MSEQTTTYLGKVFLTTRPILSTRIVSYLFTALWHFKARAIISKAFFLFFGGVAGGGRAKRLNWSVLPLLFTPMSSAVRTEPDRT